MTISASGNRLEHRNLIAGLNQGLSLSVLLVYRYLKTTGRL